MPTNVDEAHLEKVIDLLGQLKDTLQQYGGKNCVPGVNSVASELLYGDSALEKRFQIAAEQYRRLFGGSGTLGDFVIWNDDEIQRIKLNTRLTAIQDSLWNLFNLTQ